MNKRVRVVLVAGMAGILSCTGLAGAQAGGPYSGAQTSPAGVVEPSPGAGEPVPAAPAATVDGVQRAQKPSPAGCTGSTDYPHKSGNDVSVHAVMSCKKTVSRVETLTTIYRDRWYGPELVVSGSAVRDNSSTSGKATPHKSCKGQGTFTYKAYSAHASLEGGTVYKANTSNWQDPGKSRFAC